MQLNPTAPLGAEVADLSVADVDAELAEELRDALAEHGVLVLRDQDVDDAEFLAFLRLLGEPTFTAGETPLEGFPDLNVISNVGRATPPRSTFHVDTSYVAHPPAYTALRTVQVPESGGQTLFTNQYRAYDTLDGDLRDLLAGRTIRHVVTGVDLPEGAESAAEHPIFRRHPLSGRTALYMSTPARCAAVSGLSEEESADVVRRLFEHSTAAGNVLRHSWAGGDVVMWDNGVVLHKADHSGVRGERVMHRGMATGYAGRVPVRGGVAVAG